MEGIVIVFMLAVISVMRAIQIEKIERKLAVIIRHLRQLAPLEDEED